jgi:AcrR family transcriptional regulator
MVNTPQSSAQHTDGPEAARMKPGKKSKLSQELILAVAIDILDKDGPDRLSLRRIASQLDVTPRALYGHFASKDELDAAVVASVLPDLPEELDPEIAWHEQLRDSVLTVHDAMVRQHGIARLFITGSMRDTATNRIREHFLMVLFASGLDTDEVAAAVGSISRYILGCVAIEDERRRHPEIAEPDSGAADLEQFPLLSAMVERYAQRNRTESTRYGLELLISGLRARTEELSRASGSTPRVAKKTNRSATRR